MRKLLPKVMSILMALAICSASGAHWMLLQSVAWMGMVATFAQDRPLTQAVSDALDGQHPCDMCKVIAHGQRQEKKSPSGVMSGAAGKVLLYFVAEDLRLEPTSERAAFASANVCAERRCETPPSPPPRVG
jgi:hypothetical protein